MAERGQKRSPTSHRTPAQASRHWQEYGKKYKAENAKRTKARRDAIKAGRVSRGDGKDLDHMKSLRQGGSNSQSNLKVTSPSKNRAHPSRVAARGGRATGKARRS